MKYCVYVRYSVLTSCLLNYKSHFTRVADFHGRVTDHWFGHRNKVEQSLTFCDLM